MRQLSINVLLFLFLSLICLTGCKEKKIVGEGPNTEALRELSSFSKLSINGNYQVKVDFAEKQTVRVIAQANIIPHIETTVSDDTLTIAQADSVSLTYKDVPTIMITVADLSEIALSGASKITATNIKNKGITINAHGNNQFILTGKTESLSIDSNGDNEIHAENLQATDTKINIHGAGTIFTTTTGKLDAKINGYGKIGYTGNPKSITQEIHGSGIIKHVQ